MLQLSNLLLSTPIATIKNKMIPSTPEPVAANPDYFSTGALVYAMFVTYFVFSKYTKIMALLSNT